MDNVDPKVDEAIETLNMKDGPTRRKLIKGTGLVSATAAASALLAACGSSSSRRAAAAARGRRRGTSRRPRRGSSGSSTTSPRTCSSCRPRTAWRTRPRCSASRRRSGADRHLERRQMVVLHQHRDPAKAAGIATTVINATSFTTPVGNAMNAGIPVISYNADGVVTNGVPGHRHQPALLRRPGALPVRPAAWGADQVAGPDAGRGGASSSPPRDGEHPAPLRRRRVGLKPAGYNVARDRDRRGRPARSWRPRRRTCSAHKTIKGAFAVDAGST